MVNPNYSLPCNPTWAAAWSWRKMHTMLSTVTAFTVNSLPQISNGPSVCLTITLYFPCQVIPLFSNFQQNLPTLSRWPHLIVHWAPVDNYYLNFSLWDWYLTPIFSITVSSLSLLLANCLVPCFMEKKKPWNGNYCMWPLLSLSISI